MYVSVGSHIVNYNEKEKSLEKENFSCSTNGWSTKTPIKQSKKGLDLLYLIPTTTILTFPDHFFHHFPSLLAEGLSPSCPFIDQYYEIKDKLINDKSVTFPWRVTLLMHVFS